MIKDDILKKSKKTISKDNHAFEVIFSDGSPVNHKDCHWSDFSKKKEVRIGENLKSVSISKHRIKTIKVEHDGKIIHLDIPDGCDVYMHNTSQTTFYPDGNRMTTLLGRTIGIVKDDKVIEERTINLMSGEIIGFKYA